MHLKSLKIFCDVVARRNFSRAADENGISQSGASQIVHQLEDYLGVKLFDRSKRPLVLTAAGEVYYNGCRKLVQRFYALEDEIRVLHKEVAGRAQIASIYSVSFGHINQYVRDFLASHPKANIGIEYRHPQRVNEMVENDQVDLGLVSYAKSSRSIEAVPWREEVMVLACAPDHPLATDEFVRLEQLNGCTMVGFDPDLRIRREIDKALALCGAEVRMAMEFDNIETIKRAVEINAGLGLLPEPTVRREVAMGTLVTVPLAEPGLVRPLGIIRRRGRTLSTTARRFIQLLQSKANDLGPEPTTAGQNGHSNGRHASSEVASINRDGHNEDGHA